MISGNQIKFIRSLTRKKVRDEMGLFIAEGSTLVEDLLQSTFIFDHLYAVKDWLDVYAPVLQEKRIRHTEISQSQLERISQQVTPNKALAVLRKPDWKFNPDALSDKLSIALDTISDPGNMGTIIRVADWFGIQTILCTYDTTDCFSSKVVQASMGSIARVNIHCLDLKSVLSSLKTYLPVYGAVLNGKNVFSEKLTRHGIILIGNESQGISPGMRDCITHPLTIPSFTPETSHAESLNASVATAILAAEFRRQHTR